MILLPRSPIEDGFQTWSCHCGAKGIGDGATHMDECTVLAAPTDAERVEILARALNGIQRSAWLQPRSGLEERMRQTAIDALAAAGLEIWT